MMLPFSTWISLSFAIVVTVVVVSVVSLVRAARDRMRFNAELWQWHAQNPNPQVHQQSPPPTRPPKSGWSTVGTVLAAVAAVGGLAVLGGALLLFVALSNMKFGNK